MNKQHTLNLLQQRFENVVESVGDIVRAERRYHNTPLGVFYFDFSQTVAEDNFDLRSYLQDRIASDYYRHEGSLQWNYYLYFVLEPAVLRKFRSTPHAAKIETDRSFARKFLRDADTLERELTQPLAASLQRTAPSQDITSKWMEELKEAGLERIADSTEDYAPIVREYLEASNLAIRSAMPTPGNPVANGRFIKALRIEQFREHPSKKDFTFGTVNLIRGVNGTGKTSLLEAIELCLCGGIRRQRGGQPSNARLHIQFQGQKGMLLCPETSPAVYRGRDLAWYGGYYLQGNRMFDNFGRFNFFDSDAAMQLSSATNREQVLNAINALLLGGFANILEERMTQCKERFMREQRELEKNVRFWDEEFNKATNDLNQIRTIKDTREALLTELQTKAQECAWKQIPVYPKLDGLALLQEAVVDQAERFGNAARRLPWIAHLSLASLRHEATQLTNTIKEVTKLQQIESDNAIALESDGNRVSVLEMEVKAMSRLKLYHAEPEAMSLAGLEKAIETTRTILARYRESAALVSSINLKPFERSTLSLADLITQNTTEITNRFLHITKLRNRSTELQAKLGSIKSLIEEIKGLGYRFCEVNPTSDTCPLCGTTHDNLRQRIATLSIKTALESPLGELVAEIAREQAALEEFQKTGDVLEQMREAAQLLSTEGEMAECSTKAVVEKLLGLCDRLAIEKAKLDTLVAKEKRLKLAGFTERELEGLFEEAEQEYGWLRSSLEKADAVQTLLTEKIKLLDSLRAKVKEREKLAKESQMELRRLFEQRLGVGAVGISAIELERRQVAVNEVLAVALEAKNPVAMGESDEFSTVQARLETFAKCVQRIQESLKRVEEKDVLEQRFVNNLSKSQSILTVLEPKRKKATLAVGALAKLLGSKYKAAYLQQMTAEHRQGLSSFFSRIHAPHEFKEVHLEPDILLQRDTGVAAAVSEISTGQRAALALSIFLSLNSGAITRAPWILFDDPVTHVDDVNLLSFLDMLRDLVLLGDRQVFFATANTRIADLFARKFDCLGPDFQDIPLQR